MKKIIAILSIIAAAAICAAILCSCSQQKLTGTYSFGDDGNQSSITLNEDGTFEFMFSPISSYLGIGKFTYADDKVTLETSDGQYHYVFRVTEDGLVFDEDASSDMLWFGEFTDGALFE